MKCKRGCGRDVPIRKPGKGGVRKFCLICSPIRSGPRLPAPDSAPAPGAPIPLPPVEDETLRNAVRKELGEFAGTVDGVLAMKMAKLIDEAPPTASALTTLAKQMRSHITAATAGRPAVPTGVTELEDEFEARQRARAAKSA